jgi:hypothetical protein
MAAEKVICIFSGEKDDLIGQKKNFLAELQKKIGYVCMCLRFPKGRGKIYVYRSNRKVNMKPMVCPFL